MDFRYTREEEEFRRDAADWLDRALPALAREASASQAEREQHAQRWQEALFEGGWAGISWPTEYGGRGLPAVYEAIFNGEAALRDAPRPINFLAMMLAGPTLLVHGSEEQKRRFLPKILSGEEIWCQGFSEPGSGSDLASLSTRATRAPGGWVVKGEKVWTSFAHLASRCMLVARSDPAGSKHGGLTYFCAPMQGVAVAPIVMLNGDADFNQVFWDDVFVDDDLVLGGVGNGWTVALTTLAFERGALSLMFYAEARQTFDRLTALAAHPDRREDPVLLQEVGRLHGAVEALRLGVIRQMSEQGSAAPGAEGAMQKLSWAETMQQMTRFALEILGPDATNSSDGAGHDWMHAYLRARGNSIEGGTSEILRSIVAEQMLSLPRSR